MFKRLITGDGLRKTRFHNYRGELLDRTGFAYLPLAVYTTLNLKIAGKRPELPWLGYRVIKRLNNLIAKDWAILEFGSGMSTVWLAKRCGKLISVETDQRWFKHVSQRLRSFKHVDYRLLPIESCHDVSDGPFDLVIVDGMRRHASMQTAIHKVKTGGHIYLDNSDVPWDEFVTARTSLVKVAKSIEAFNDFAPTTIAVQEGVLGRF
jgi:predicted O-methyltransferase YrrM